MVLPFRRKSWAIVSSLVWLIFFPFVSLWWMVIFAPSAVIAFHGSGRIETVVTGGRKNLSSLCLSAPPYVPPTSFCRAVCLSLAVFSRFGHRFLLESVSIWFKFSWEMRGPAAACRHRLVSTGISLYSHLFGSFSCDFFFLPTVSFFTDIFFVLFWMTACGKLDNESKCECVRAFFQIYLWYLSFSN